MCVCKKIYIYIYIHVYTHIYIYIIYVYIYIYYSCGHAGFPVTVLATCRCCV